MNYLYATGVGATATGMTYISFQVLVMGLFLSGGFFIADENTVGVDTLVSFSDLDLGKVNVPLPVSEVKDISVSWAIHDYESGELINSDSYYIASIMKNEPTFIQKQITLAKPVSEINKIVIKLKVSGSVHGLKISRDETIIADTNQLIKGFKFEF